MVEIIRTYLRKDLGEDIVRLKRVNSQGYKIPKIVNYELREVSSGKTLGQGNTLASALNKLMLVKPDTVTRKLQAQCTCTSCQPELKSFSHISTYLKSLFNRG